MFLTNEGELRGGQREEVWQSGWNSEGSKNSILRLGVLGPAEDTLFKAGGYKMFWSRVSRLASQFLNT